jgi:hypothetical protein
LHRLLRGLLELLLWLLRRELAVRGQVRLLLLVVPVLGSKTKTKETESNAEDVQHAD